MTQPKKLIEVAMPIKEISAESVRDKSIRHGHISTLHLWWARRPLPVCRAVVFASLYPKVNGLRKKGKNKSLVKVWDLSCPKMSEKCCAKSNAKTTNEIISKQPFC